MSHLACINIMIYSGVNNSNLVITQQKPGIRIGPVGHIRLV